MESRSPSDVGQGARGSSDGRYRAGLVVFGVIELLLALVLSVFVVLLTLTPALIGSLTQSLEPAAGAPSPGGASQGMSRTIALMSALVYGGLCALFTWIGVGSLYPRRWVRPVVAYFSTLWLVAGVAIFLAAIALMPSLFGSLGALDAGGEAADSTMLSIIVGAMVYGLLFVMYVALPAALVWFHCRTGLKSALERLDPVPRWTDRCPPPVLRLSFSLALSAFFCLPFALGPLPLFGRILTAAGAACVVLPSAALLAFLAVATYRLSPAGWWGTLIAVVAFTAVSVDASLEVKLADFVDAFAIPELGPPEPPSAAAAVPWLLAAGSVLFGLVCLVAVLRLRRYFSVSISPRSA